MDVMIRNHAEAPGSVRDSFDSFYRGEWRNVVGLAYVLTGDWGVAEDLAQEAFSAAAQKWERVRAMDRPGAWVRRVVANRSVSWFRRRSAEGRALSRLGNPASDAAPEVDARTAEVWTSVRQLPKRQAQAIALVYFDGMKIEEASRVMGCGRETARTHLKRGRKALANRLGLQEGHHA